MTPKIDLKELSARESEQVEWKRRVADPEDLLRTIAAFANDFQNMGGGYVVCGAEELRDAHGFPRVEFPGLTAQRFKEIESKVMADARAKISPPVTPLIEEIPGAVEGQRVLVFIVPATNYAHSYRASGKDASTHYVRIGRETVEARNGVLRELLVRKQAMEPWDRRLNFDATLADIDLLVFREVLEEIGVWNPSVGVEDYFSDAMRLHALMPSLGGRRKFDPDLHPRNFSLIMFGKTPTRFFPGAWTKVSVYPGKDRGDAMSERTELTGSIISQARKALELLRAHPTTAFDKESPDPNAPKYPERALQEAVINAIVHRDYEMDDPTNITVFSDRVEIRSPGALIRTIDRTKFLQGKAAPSWRNQSLAWIFNKLQLAQAEGQGIPTILRTMKQLGSPDPRFDLEEASVTCVLPAHPRHELLRHVAEIERLLVQQDITEAQAKLNTLLESQPAAPNLLGLLAQISIAQKRPERVGEYIRERSLDPSDFPTATVIQLLEALRDSANSEDRNLAKIWIGPISKRRLEADEVKRVAVALRKLDRDEDAVQLIGRFIALQSSPLAVPAALYDMRARAKIDLAKKCVETARNPSTQRDLRGRAWDQCRQYLEEAESDILTAIENEPSPREKEFIERDLLFVRQLMKQSERPQRKDSGFPRKNGQNRKQ